MHIIFLICTIWLIEAPSLDADNHALYLSMTEVHVKKDSMEVVVKVFSDDLRDAIKNDAPTAYLLDDLSQFFSQNKRIATDYFNNNLKLFANDSSLKLVLKGHTIEGDAHFITFTSQFDVPIQKITAEATFLMELFPTQVNVVKINDAKKTHFMKFTKASEPQSVNLQR